MGRTTPSLFLLSLCPSPISPSHSPESHQRTTAEQDHEDDEGLKPIVLYNEEAGFPKDPPGLA